MSVLTPELTEEISTSYGQYTDLLNSAGIDSAAEYVNRAETDSWDQPEDIEIGLHSFFRCFPGGDQDIAMVQLNPKLKVSDANFVDGEYNLYNSAGTAESPEFDTIASVAPNWTAPWLLKDSSNPMIVQLISALSDSGVLSTDFQSVDEYLQVERANEFKRTHSGGVDPSTGFFSDFYYTNWFKFATRNGDRIDALAGSSTISPDDFSRLATETVIHELNTVNPDIVFVCGADPWVSLRPEQLDDRLGREVDGSNVTSVEGYLFETTHDWDIIPMAQKSYYDARNNAFDPTPFRDSFNYL
jgi:hypothetical protein